MLIITCTNSDGRADISLYAPGPEEMREDLAAELQCRATPKYAQEVLNWFDQGGSNNPFYVEERTGRKDEWTVKTA